MSISRILSNKFLRAAIVIAGLIAIGAVLLGRIDTDRARSLGFEVDRAFMDPANKYTIRLIQYDANEANLGRARATAEHLRRIADVPVYGPISMGKILVLCAGHAPKIADLDPLLKRVRPLAGPPPQDRARPFETAYVVNIDDVVKRD